MTSRDRAWTAAACAAAVPCVLLPVANPDLFWHLSAAARMLQTRAVPTRDWLSFTRPGAPWVDFEWGAQALFWIAHACGGLAGLWALKALLVSACACVSWRTLGAYRLAPPLRAAGIALWSAAMLARSDIRPDLFSVAGFSLLFLFLEARRIERRRLFHPAWMILFFAIWANLHAGFVFGLALLALYGAWPHLLAGALGTLIQPAGFGAYGVLWEHWGDAKLLASQIVEWGPPGLRNPWYWPSWFLLFFGPAGAAVRLFQDRRMAFGPVAAILAFGVFAAGHARLGAYYVALAVPLGLYWWREAGFLPASSQKRAAFAAVAACLVYGVSWGSEFGLFRTTFHPRFAPVEAARFLAKEKAVLGGKPLYEEWGWGGYIGWNLYPDYLVFQDGRYIFHSLLKEEAAAQASPEAWQSFLEAHGVQAALMLNLDWRLPTTRVYPDGSSKEFRRPYYALYMPKNKWALVYWDDKALLFVRRGAAPPAWLKAHEYLYARPHDDDALRDALSRGEIPRPKLDAEFLRHSADVKRL